MTMDDQFPKVHNDLSKIQLLEDLDFVNHFDTVKLTNGEYDRLRTLAEKYLTYQTLFQLLSAKLPWKPGVENAWKLLGDCIMCSDEEADKRRKLEYETESRMRYAKIRHDQEKRQQDEERKRTIETALRQQHKLQRIVDELQESAKFTSDLLRTLQ